MITLVTDTMATVGEVRVNHNDSKGYSDVDSFVPWDNPDNVITYETYSVIDNIIFCYCNPIMFFIGVPSNVLNCVVFFRQGSCSCLLLSVALPPTP